MVIEYLASLLNNTHGHKIPLSTFFNLRHSKIYPNLEFWFEKKPSGNPGQVQKIQHSTNGLQANPALLVGPVQHEHPSGGIGQSVLRIDKMER
jgi:hypothetical protein